jgi:RNA polymerase sigma-70 factor (ECF subfamily)
MFDQELTSRAPLESDTQRIALGLRQREAAVLETLVEQYQHRLVRYLVSLLGRRYGVDDLVQETWLRVLERGGSYDGRYRFEPWLFRVARNIALDTMRKRSMNSLEPNEEDDRSSPASAEASPYAHAARTQDAERLADAVQSLEPVYREALVLRFQEDLSLQEISVIVGAPVSTVASRIYRGLATLRPQLEGETS